MVVEIGINNNSYSFNYFGSQSSVLSESSSLFDCL